MDERKNCKIKRKLKEDFKENYERFHCFKRMILAT